MVLVRVGHPISRSKHQKNLPRKSPTMGRILAGCFWTWTLPRKSAPFRYHFHHVHCRLYTRDGAKKNREDVRRCCFSSLPAQWRLACQPAKVACLGGISSEGCNILSPSPVRGSSGSRFAAPWAPRRPDTHGTLLLFLFFSSSTTYFRGSLFWGAGFRAENKDLG